MTDSQTLSTDRQTHRKAIQLGDILLSTHFQRTDFVQKTQNNIESDPDFELYLKPFFHCQTRKMSNEGNSL